MTLEERLERMEIEDILIIAELLETPGGRIAALLTQNLLNKELSFSRHDTASAERKIGRLEAYRTILDDFTDFAKRKKELQTPIAQDEEEAQPMAVEQTTTPGHRGGEI